MLAFEDIIVPLEALCDAVHIHRKEKPCHMVHLLLLQLWLHRPPKAQLKAGMVQGNSP